MNTHNDGAVLISRGRLFHASGAAMEKPPSPNLILVRGRTMFRLFVERRRLLDGSLTTGTILDNALRITPLIEE